MHITTTNASSALSELLSVVLGEGEQRGSRNGPVIAMDEPVTVTYEHPDQRVIFYPEREANPFFHLYECLWMMRGARDVAAVAEFVPGMRNFSDDGRVFNAAYGHRWRKHFGVDQVMAAVRRLREPGAAEDRRTYVAMWDPRADTRPSLDLPCNVGVAFRVRSDGRLDMTVFNRSNDLVLGLAGANVVHMSFLHEFVARASGHPLGRYHQVTNDLHLYLLQPSTAPVMPLAGTWSAGTDPYLTGRVSPFPVMSEDSTAETWLEDLETFHRYGPVVGLRDRFFRRVASPVIQAHKAYRAATGADRYLRALEVVEQCLADDWREACRDWLQRRYDKWKEKAL